MQRVRCKRCYAPWWETAKLRDNKGALVNKWANGAPAWLKEPKPQASATKEESTTSKNISSIQKCLEILGEEESELRQGLQQKLQGLKEQQPKQQEELEVAKEVSALMKEQQNMEQAIASLKGVSGCEEFITHMSARLTEMESKIRDMTKRPAEERLRSLQDKKNHRIKVLKSLDQDLESAREKLEALQEKEKEHSKELDKINAELKQVMKELNISTFPMEGIVLNAPQATEGAVLTNTPMGGLGEEGGAPMGDPQNMEGITSANTAGGELKEENRTPPNGEEEQSAVNAAGKAKKGKEKPLSNPY